MKTVTGAIGGIARWSLDHHLMSLYKLQSEGEEGAYHINQLNQFVICFVIRVENFTPSRQP